MEPNFGPQVRAIQQRFARRLREYVWETLEAPGPEISQGYLVEAAQEVFELLGGNGDVTDHLLVTAKPLREDNAKMKFDLDAKSDLGESIALLLGIDAQERV